MVLTWMLTQNAMHGGTRYFEASEALEVLFVPCMPVLMGLGGKVAFAGARLYEAPNKDTNLLQPLFLELGTSIVHVFASSFYVAVYPINPYVILDGDPENCLVPHISLESLGPPMLINLYGYTRVLFCLFTSFGA